MITAATSGVHGHHYATDLRAQAIVIVAIAFVFVAGLVRPLVASLMLALYKWRRASSSKIAKVQKVRESNPLSVFEGKDGRLSTSKTVALAWTFVACYIIAVLILDKPASWSDAFANLSPNYLLLLAGPYGSLVLAKGIVSYRTNSGTLVKPQLSGSARLSDVVADDSGDIDIFDVQFLLFNGLALWFVVDAFNRATSDGFPDIPSGLILLTGGPAAVYLSNKTFGDNGTTQLKSVTPSRLLSGATFVILGSGFLDGQAKSDAEGSLTINGYAVDAADTRWTDTRITGTAPALPDGDGVAQTVTVTTPAGNVGTLANAITIDQRPVIVGFDHQTVHAGQDVVMQVEWPPSTKINSLSTIECGDVLLQGPPVGPGAHNIEFTVPALAAGDARLEITVHGSGRQSDPAYLDVS